jgi:hypothetical protein
MRSVTPKHEIEYLRESLAPVIRALRDNPALQAELLTWVVEASGGLTEPVQFVHRLLKLMDKRTNYQSPSAYTVALLLKFAASKGI